MATSSTTTVSVPNTSAPTTTSPLMQSVSVTPPAPASLSASIVIPPQQPVIDLTQHTDISQPATKSSAKPILPALPASLSQMPQNNTKRSPSPNLLSTLQTVRARSTSPALVTKSQSSSQVLHSRSRSPIAMVMHSHSEPAVSHAEPPPTKKKRLFHRELMSMMRGFGDDPNPYAETVDLIEELVIRFITEMTQKAMEVGKSGRVQVNDIIFIIRKDPKKYARVKDLLMMKEQIDKAKKAFAEDAETNDE